MDMNFAMRPEMRALLARVTEMIRDEVVPLEAEYQDEINKGDRWTYTPRQAEILEGLKAKAKADGLWNFWLTDSDKGFGLNTVEYAYFAEEMGRTPLGAEVFNWPMISPTSRSHLRRQAIEPPPYKVHFPCPERLGWTAGSTCSKTCKAPSTKRSCRCHAVPTRPPCSTRLTALACLIG